MANKVAVVGSLSLDLVMQVPRRPVKGETIIGSDFCTFVGGKGNNQALAAARAGAQVSMIGRVGRDAYGRTIIDTLAKDGIDTTFVKEDSEAGTGIANIYVDPEGDNSIVIVQRANARLSPQDIDQAKDMIQSADIVLMQLEIPIETVVHAAAIAKDAGVRIALNPAPAPASLPKELVQMADILIPNEPEAELLTETTFDHSDPDSVKKVASLLHQKGVGTVILTLGERGAFVSNRTGESFMVPAFPVIVRDTTAAGDAFCGALAAALSSGLDLKKATRFASAAGALATTKAGAEPSLPKKSDIERLGSPC